MEDKIKIYCVEKQKKNLDKNTFKDIQKMVGWIEPPDKEGESWDVTMSDGDGFSCKDQATAQILAGIEEIKAILLEKK